MVIDSPTEEIIVTTSSTNDRASPKRTSSNKLDNFETDYIKERNTPIPSTLHAHIQSNLIFELRSHFAKQYDVFSKLSLELSSKRAMPDVAFMKIKR
jgi:hypothetical protein